ncbi:MAG TPA: GNAT family N-acetyltransferase [Chroococcidiopsis sp.]
MSTFRPELNSETIGSDRVNGHGRSLLPGTTMIRAARTQDLSTLAEVLTSSFHDRQGWMSWMYPLFYMGIYEDLKSRLRLKTAHYACLVAVPQAIAPDPRPDAPQAGDRPGDGLADGALPGNLPGNLPASPPILGTVELSRRQSMFWPADQPRHLYISNLAVQENHRRQGIAHQLLATCDKIALDWGYQEIYLHVLENNHAARRLYWKAGYRLHKIESRLSTWLLNSPRQLYLRKQL